MLNEQTLKFLLEKIIEIQKLFKKYGLENLRLYKPADVDDWVKINFLVDKKNKDFMSHELDSIEDKVKLLLDCEIHISVNTMVRDDFVRRISEEAVPYTEDSKSKLEELFNKKLLPLAERYQQKNLNKKRYSFEFFSEEGLGESVQKKNKGEDNSPSHSPSSSPKLGREMLLANKLFEEHATEILSLSPPEKEEFIKHFCKSAGIDIDITPRPIQKV